MRSRGTSLLRVALLLVIALPIGCRREPEGVLLRFAPEVGAAYRYTFTINRPPAPIELPAEMRVVSKEEHGYVLQFPGILNELFSGSLVVTERHNANHPGYISLNFPDDPVAAGAEWGGDVPWYYEHYYVLDPTEMRVPASYRLLSVEHGENGRQAIIEQRIDVDVAVDDLVLHVGQVGVRWDQQGRVTNVYEGYDADGKLLVGDTVVAINGLRAETAGGLALLAEQFVQHPKPSAIVTFTVRRDGKEHDVDVTKSVDEFAVVRVHDKKDVARIVHDVDRGILLSVEVSSSYSVEYTSPTADPFPVVDDYGGFHKFGYLSGKTSFQDHLDSSGVAWSLSLVE